MKRVAIDINSVLPLYGRGWVSGIGRTTKGLVEALDRINNLPFKIALYSQNTRDITGRKLGLGFETIHISLPHKPTINKVIGKTHLREIALNYDLLHIPHNFEYVRRPEKTVVTLHDALFFVHPDEVFDSQHYCKLYPTLAKRCRAIITPSQASKHDIMQYMDIPDDRIFVCPWGCDRELFRPLQCDAPQHPFFLSVSCSTGRKNTMAVIRSYEKIVHQHPRHLLVLVWSNVPDEVAQYCNQPNLKDKVQIMSNVSDQELVKLYNQATTTFFPSRYEGFGLPVLESMTCGTPVVTCNNSALSEVGGDAALYVEPDDIDAMARYMEEFEQGNMTKQALQQSCLAQASKFSMEECAKLTADVYTKCLN